MVGSGKAEYEFKYMIHFRNLQTSKKNMIGMSTAQNTNHILMPSIIENVIRQPNAINDK